MKLLHTSDWHLGRALYGRKRYAEFARFLEWLGETIEREKIEALLVAGDIFDNGTPSNRAQELYYGFLCRIASSSTCRQVVIIAGNHDSPSFLNAPGELLKVLNVHVIGYPADETEDEIIVLRDESGRPRALVGAVPYLRDRDIRTVEPGESIADKSAKLVNGIRKHYAEICAHAEEKRTACKRQGHPELPFIAMGHLFTTGGKTVTGDGVRELYVGSLAHVGAEIFPPGIDYLALGHLHLPQTVGGREHFRYSGSPLPLGFGEAGQEKKVVIIEFAGRRPAIRELPVPCFQELEKVTGSLEEILDRLEQLKQNDSSAWLEIEYTGDAVIGNLREELDQALAGSRLVIIRIRNRRFIDRIISRTTAGETLEDLDVHEVFERCLEAFAVPAEERDGLRASYREIVTELREGDIRAE